MGTWAVLVNCFGLESSFISNSDKFSLFSLSGTESIHRVPRPVPGTVRTHLEGSKFHCQLAEDADKPDGGQIRCSVGVGLCMSTRVTTLTREGGDRKGRLHG